MGQTNINIRLDEDLKKEFNLLCDDLGMNVTTAINIFIKKAVKEWGIPFEVKGQKPSKENFLKALENAEVCDDQENQELLQALNSMSEEDKKIVKSEVVTW
ncbi:type II toxin-antitoxin system RelB/DinJ family antitoxin [Fusobacterium perfoetens]|uniref:type II toxin-antitoxin system RelB/DinJ family antitoxin n=1 Tax=Fusobacterium perfoetens TaxID=852 RepID=UPI001F45D705|nr:type II toxin-antitoxin system RelB/DinJ family antitoxin [Fusobacterium perfoetens]MCF2625009.1 type II toxin-antitoxin system RelB/DinJ family antitoxin [Fusobacterium perfoetens]